MTVLPMFKVATASETKVSRPTLVNMPLASNGPPWPASSLPPSSSVWVLEKTANQRHAGVSSRAAEARAPAAVVALCTTRSTGHDRPNQELAREGEVQRGRERKLMCRGRGNRKRGCQSNHLGGSPRPMSPKTIIVHHTTTHLHTHTQ